jgi:hypothetical protein
MMQKISATMNTSGHKINPITTETVITAIKYAMLYKIEKFSASVVTCFSHSLRSL